MGLFKKLGFFFIKTTFIIVFHFSYSNFCESLFTVLSDRYEQKSANKFWFGSCIHTLIFTEKLFICGLSFFPSLMTQLSGISGPNRFLSSALQQQRRVVANNSWFVVNSGGDREELRGFALSVVLVAICGVIEKKVWCSLVIWLTKGSLNRSTTAFHHFILTDCDIVIEIWYGVLPSLSRY